MGKYIKLFNTEQEYTAFTQSQDYIEPNVSWVTGETEIVHYNPYVFEPPILSIGTVCYYNTNKQHLKFCNVSDYNSANGPAVGLVVVPNNCTPDGTVRIMSVKGCTSAGATATTEQSMTCGLTGIDTGLPDLNKVPIWNNNESSAIGNNNYGIVPSDKFNQIACYGNTGVSYYSNYPYIPPIITQDGEPNTDCLIEIDNPNTNCLLDFNGAGNTAVLVALGSNYRAASACSMYSVDGLTSGWYLPACGELVYILPMFTVLQSALSAVGGASLNTSGDYWSSTEYSTDYGIYVGTKYGGVERLYRTNSRYVRPFHSIELTPEYL